MPTKGSLATRACAEPEFLVAVEQFHAGLEHGGVLDPLVIHGALEFDVHLRQFGPFRFGLVGDGDRFLLRVFPFLQRFLQFCDGPFLVGKAGFQFIDRLGG